MAAVADLRELLSLLVTFPDVTYVRCGELALRRDPALAPSRSVPATLQAPPAPSQPEPADSAEERDLEDLLYSSGVDPQSFLRAVGAAKAAGG